MDLQLKGKRALVTGASQGIGFSIAESLANEGCDVVMVARDAEVLQKSADQLAKLSGAKIETIPADLSCKEGISLIANQVGHLDILVNNAGAIPHGDLLELDELEWRKGWDLKVFGYIGVTKALYSTLKKTKGVVINVIGAAGVMPNPDYIAGSSGNAALMMFTRSLAKTARSDGIRAVGINPGPVATSRFESLVRAQAQKQLNDAERWDELLVDMPFGRAAAPAEIGDAVAFFASPRSAYTSGAIINIDGGMS